MDRAYFEEYYELERHHWWFRAREAILKKQVERLKLPKTCRILNIGAATGRSSQWLTAHGEVVSVEYDATCVEFVREKLGIDVRHGSITELDFADESFDLVCAFDVIEHVDEDALGVSEMFRVCKREGYVFVSVPAFSFLWSAHDDVNHHQRRYTMRQLRRLFHGEGRQVFVSYFNTLLFPPIAAYRLLSSKTGSTSHERHDAGSDFFALRQGTTLQKLLYRIFLTENRWLKNRLSFPFGVSILGIWHKSI